MIEFVLIFHAINWFIDYCDRLTLHHHDYPIPDKQKQQGRSSRTKAEFNIFA